MRFIIALVVIKNWKLTQLDINNAFLHGELDETIYMDLPPGLMHQNSKQVCLLHKSLYGLQQTSRQWYAQLSTFLLTHKFTQSFADHSLFIRDIQGKIIIILVYVDDIIVTGSDPDEIQLITSLLDQKFKLKNLVNLTYFLGFEIARSHLGINLSQRKYTMDLLCETGMLNSSPISTPMNFSTKLHAYGEPVTDPSAYRRLIEKLIYLTNTRPDITYAINQLSQYVSAPTKDHHQVAYRVLRYLKGTVGQGIFMDAKSDVHLKAYSDSDWAGCIDSRRSVTGYLVYLGNTIIAWKSKK